MDLPTVVKAAFKSNESSDITISVADKYFDLHKLVICGQSEHLKILCYGEDEIELEELNNLEYPQAYDAMFRFMYGFEYDKDADAYEGCIYSRHIGFHFDVYRVASSYEVPRLASLALKNLKEYTQRFWNKDYFVEALEKWNHNTERALKNLLVAACHKQIEELSTHPDFQRILRENNELAAEIACRFAESMKKNRCTQCNMVWSLDSTFLPSPSYCPNCGQPIHN